MRQTALSVEKSDFLETQKINQISFKDGNTEEKYS